MPQRLHYQTEPLAQSKLITVIKGEIQDVALDIRKSSKTFGKYFSIILSDNSKTIIYPKALLMVFNII